MPLGIILFLCGFALFILPHMGIMALSIRHPSLHSIACIVVPGYTFWYAFLDRKALPWLVASIAGGIIALAGYALAPVQVAAVFARLSHIAVPE